MLVNLRGLSHSVATLGVLLLFPGFAVYHYLVASGWMPPFVGGLFGIVSLALVLVCLLLSAWVLSARVWGGLAQAQFFVLSWTYFLIWTVVGYVTVVSEPYANPGLRESISTVMIWLAMFYVGAFYQLETSTQRLLLVGFAIAAVGLLVHAMMVRDSLIGPLLVFGTTDDAEIHTSTYQGVGRSIMVTAILVAALSSQHWKQLAVLSLAVLTLVALGSRAHLFTIVCLILAMLVLFALRGRRRAPLVAFMLVAGVGVYVGWSVFLDTRAAEFLDLSTSSSWQGRLEVQSMALDVIRANPLSGSFAYHLRDIGEGGYAHNALSAWTQFGLVGFVLYSSLIVYFTTLSLRKLLSPQTTNTLWRISFGLNFASLVLALAAESVFSVVPALGWGFAVNALLVDRRRSVIARVV